MTHQCGVIGLLDAVRAVVCPDLHMGPFDRVVMWHQLIPTYKHRTQRYIYIYACFNTHCWHPKVVQACWEHAEASLLCMHTVRKQTTRHSNRIVYL